MLTSTGPKPSNVNPDGSRVEPKEVAHPNTLAADVKVLLEHLAANLDIVDSALKQVLEGGRGAKKSCLDAHERMLKLTAEVNELWAKVNR